MIDEKIYYAIGNNDSTPPKNGYWVLNNKFSPLKDTDVLWSKTIRNIDGKITTIYTCEGHGGGGSAIDKMDKHNPIGDGYFILGHQNGLDIEKQLDSLLVIGKDNVFNENTPHFKLTIIGRENEVDGGVSQHVVVGDNNKIMPGIIFSQTIGFENEYRHSGIADSVLIGNKNIGGLGARGTLLGSYNRLESNSMGIILIGNSNWMPETLERGLSDAAFAIIIGNNHSFSSPSYSESIMIGRGCSAQGNLSTTASINIGYSNDMGASNGGVSLIIPEEDILIDGTQFERVNHFNTILGQHNSIGSGQFLSIIGFSNETVFTDSFKENVDNFYSQGSSGYKSFYCSNYGSMLGQNNTFYDYAEHFTVSGCNNSVRQYTTYRNTHPLSHFDTHNGRRRRILDNLSIFGNYNKVTTNALYSTILGYNNICDDAGMTIIGTYNKTETNAAFVIGNGIDDSNRSDLLVLDWNGNLFIKDENITEKINNKQNQLVEGTNIELVEQEDGTVKISATTGGGAGIDDETIGANSTWSSQKINNITNIQIEEEVEVNIGLNESIEVPPSIEILFTAKEKCTLSKFVQVYLYDAENNEVWNSWTDMSGKDSMTFTTTEDTKYLVVKKVGTYTGTVFKLEYSGKIQLTAQEAYNKLQEQIIGEDRIKELIEEYIGTLPDLSSSLRKEY